MKRSFSLRLAALLAAAAMAVTASGCIKTPDMPAPSAPGSVTAADTGSFTPDDIALCCGSATLHIGDDVSAALSALGSDYQYAESPSCNYAHNGPNGDDGMDKFYDYADASITTCPFQPGGDFIRSAEAWGGEWVTEDGVGIGSTLSDIQAAYGTGYSDVGGMIIFYSYPEDATSSQLYFLMEGDIVTGIGIA